MAKGWSLADLSEDMRERNKTALESSGVAETLQKRKPRRRPEGELQDQIIAHLQDLGYKVAHFRPARVMRDGVEVYETPVAADGAGWPDIVALNGRGSCVVIEVKSDVGTVRDEQGAWLQAWATVPGAAVLIVRPSSWEDVKKWLR